MLTLARRALRERAFYGHSLVVGQFEFRQTDPLLTPESLVTPLIVCIIPTGNSIHTIGGIHAGDFPADRAEHNRREG